MKKREEIKNINNFTIKLNLALYKSLKLMLILFFISEYFNSNHNSI